MIICLSFFVFCFHLQDHFWKNAVFDVSNSLNEDNKKAAKKWVREIRNKFPKAVDVKTVFLDAKKEKSSKFSTNAFLNSP